MNDRSFDRRGGEKTPPAIAAHGETDAHAGSVSERQAQMLDQPTVSAGLDDNPLPRFRNRKRQEQGEHRTAISRMRLLAGKLSKSKLLAGRSGLIAIVFLLLGPVMILFADLDGMEAAVTALSSSGVALLAVLLGVLSRDNALVRARGMQERFEQLEDMAWELSESEERYRTLAETFGDLLVLRDGNGKITFANKAFLDLDLSRAALEKIATWWEDPLAGNIATACNGNTDAENGYPHGREVCIGSDKNARWFHWVNLPVRDRHGSGTGILSVARDVTAFKQAARDQADAREKAEQASRAKSRFLAMVSHEMRTPLNGILGMSRLMGDTGLSPEQANYNRALSRSADSLLGLINGMLDMTMIEAGRFKLDIAPFDIRNLVRDSGEIMAQRAHEKGIEFAIHLADDAPHQIVSDAGRIRQIIVNLAGNAVKFTPSGGVKLTLGARTAANGTARLVISVTDTGPGIGEADAKRIFAEFERIEKDGEASVEGAGLGLAIAKALAGELGGRLKLRSTGPTGSAFVFEMPFEPAASNANPITPKTDQALKKPGPSSTCALIVSRNKLEADVLSSILDSLETRSRIIGEPEEAVATTVAMAGKGRLRVFFDPEHFDDAAALYSALCEALAENGECTVCVKPNDRDWLASLKANHDSSWLMRPVRPESVLAILEGRFDHAEPARVGQPAGHPGEQPEDGDVRQPHIPANMAPVLLAEDNDINALLVTAALKRAGISVERVENGREAADQHARRLASGMPFGLVLMDMQMPRMNGLEAISAIRAHEAGKSAAPVHIQMLTADEQSTTRENALDAGADGVLVKPLDPAALVDICETALGRADGRIAAAQYRHTR